MTKKYFIRQHTNNSVDRNDGGEKESGGQDSCGQQALVCSDCSCWIQFDTLGCTIPWAEMKGSTVFKCKGCTEVARLSGEVEDLRKWWDWKKQVEKQGIERQC